MRFLFRLAVISVLACFTLNSQEKIPAYKNPKLTIEDRVAHLLSRMTLEEKVAQISGGGDNNEGLIDTTGKLPYKNAAEVFKDLYDVNNNIGPRQRALIHNALQR